MNQPLIQHGQKPDESDEEFDKREAAHLAEINRRRQSLLNVRANIEARFGKSAEPEAERL